MNSNESDIIHKEILLVLSQKRLKELCSGIIDAYHCGDAAFLRAKAECFLSPEEINQASVKKLFLYLVKKLHPDRHIALLNELEEAREYGNVDWLIRFRQLLSSHQVKRPVVPLKNYDTGYQEEYRYGTEDFGYDVEEGESDELYAEEEDFSDFLQALKEDLVGNSGYILSPQDLEHLDGSLNLSHREISSLQGLELCVNLTALDLGFNNISRIGLVGELVYLQELNLSGNDISDISPLSHLKHLSILELKSNDIDDLSPLLDCPALQFLDIRNNPVSDGEILNELIRRDIVVLYDMNLI